MCVSCACAPGSMPALRPHKWGQCHQLAKRNVASATAADSPILQPTKLSREHKPMKVDLTRRWFENTKRVVQDNVLDDAKFIVLHDVLGVLKPPPCRHRSCLVSLGRGASLTQDPECRPLDIPECAPAPALLTPPLAGLVAAAAHKGCKLAVGHLELAGPELRHLSGMHRGREAHMDNGGRLAPAQSLANTLLLVSIHGYMMKRQHIHWLAAAAVSCMSFTI